MSRAVIVAYHRVSAIDWDPLRMAVHPETFAAQIARLSSIADVVPLSDVLERSSDPRIAITFDDGYQDAFSRAAPLLREHKIPATFFIVTGMVRSGAEFWWDQLERIVRAARPSDLTIRINRVEIPFNAGSDREQITTFKTLFRLLRELPPGRIVSELRLLEEASSPASSKPRSDLTLTEGQISEIVADPLFSVGAHTVSHARLTTIDEPSMVEEISESRNQLQRVSGSIIDLFAYPYGDPDAINPRVVAAVESVGYRAACANWDGWIDEATDRFLLPRHVVTETTAGDLTDSVRTLLATTE